NLPGPMYCWYVRNTYLEDNLRSPGRTTQCGVKVDLSTIDVPTYVLASREDHIVPWQTAYGTTRLVSGDVRFVLGASGHVAGGINPAARSQRSYWADGEQGKSRERWMETAREIPGSWWPDWSSGLRSHWGSEAPARARLGTGAFPEIEPAPGRYV